MSKTLKGGHTFVLGGNSVPFEIENVTDFGSSGTIVELENSDKRTEWGQFLSYYLYSNAYVASIQAIMADSEPPFTLTNPQFLTPNKEVNIYIDITGLSHLGYVYIYETKEVEVPDKVFEFFYKLSYVDATDIDVNLYSNTDGVNQTIYNIHSKGIEIDGNLIYPDCDVAITGGNVDVVNIRGTGHVNVLSTIAEQTFTLTSPYTGGPDGKIKTIKAQYYPHKPTIERINRNGSIFIRVTTNVPAHGNIYFNGSAEPAYTYTTSRVAPYTAEIEINQAGAYTANIISEVVIENQHYFAYGELSDSLIVETRNVECILSFNEYTGVISCIPNIEGSAEKFTLQKQSGSEWINVSENTIGEFHITEGGTYKIIPTFGIFFMGTVFPESITVITTLNTPVAYSDPAFPSQLGFDEVEDANMYDIYRVNEDGDDELVATISPNNIISRIMRKEKMFIVIPNDEVRNV